MEVQGNITRELLDSMSTEEIGALNSSMEKDLDNIYDTSMRKLVLEHLEERERLEEMIGKFKTDNFLSMDIKGIEVKIQRTLTRQQRRDIINLDKKKDSMTVEQVEDITYDFMADISLEKPFNQREFWEKLDEATGEVMGIYIQASAMIQEELDAMAGFREGRGPSVRRNVHNSRRPKEPEEPKPL